MDPELFRQVAKVVWHEFQVTEGSLREALSEETGKDDHRAGSRPGAAVEKRSAGIDAGDRCRI